MTMEMLNNFVISVNQQMEHMDINPQDSIITNNIFKYKLKFFRVQTKQ